MSEIAGLDLKDGKVSISDCRLIADAACFAAAMHGAQLRSVRGDAYVNHLAEVALYCALHDPFDATLVVAAWLHDTLEETDAKVDDLRARFGDAVAKLVLDVTDPPGLKGKQRRQRQVDHTAASGPRVKLLKIADKTSNVLELVGLADATFEIKSAKRYLKWARRVVDVSRGLDEAMEHRFDVATAALEAKIGRCAGM